MALNTVQSIKQSIKPFTLQQNCGLDQTERICIRLSQMISSALDVSKEESIVGKHFFFHLPAKFSKTFLQGSLKPEHLTTLGRKPL